MRWPQGRSTFLQRVPLKIFSEVLSASESWSSLANAILSVYWRQAGTLYLRL